MKLWHYSNNNNRRIWFLFISACLFSKYYNHFVCSMTMANGEVGDDRVTNITSMDPDVWMEILHTPGPYANAEEEAACLKMIQELSEEDQEVAARTSYAYWAYTVGKGTENNEFCSQRNKVNEKQHAGMEFTNGNITISHVHLQMRQRMAMREARRHLVGEGGKYENGLITLQKTIEFRKQWNIDLVRSCSRTDTNASAEGDDARQQRLHYFELIKKDLSNQLMVVRGYDRENRAVLIKMGRESSETDPQGYTLAQIYMAERALACTEVRTRGLQEKITVVFDFKNYSSAHSPPKTVILSTVKALQGNYPERLAKLVILDPPLWMRGVYALVYPFLATETRQKVVLTSGAAQKEQHLSPLIDASQASPLLLPDGKLKPEVDLHRMLHDVPFHALYDEALVPSSS